MITNPRQRGRHPVHPGRKFLSGAKGMARSPQLIGDFLGQIFPVFPVIAVRIAYFVYNPLVLPHEPDELA